MAKMTSQSSSDYKRNIRLRGVNFINSEYTRDLINKAVGTEGAWGATASPWVKKQNKNKKTTSMKSKGNEEHNKCFH